MNNLKNNNSFLFYDYETFGIHPALDKVSQFACIRTDLNLNILNKKYCFYCYPPNDYLPNPESVLLTGITPQYVQQNGLNEFYFSKKIFKILNNKNTCIIGYNNIQFDDEITRNLFYRNFLDPYAWSWRNHNSRWDVICLIRACYILTPHGIVWPKNQLGFVSFKLQDLTRANSIDHHAHDALSDVYATISIMHFIKQKKPELFNFFFKYRLKDNLKMLINTYDHTPLIYISHFFGSTRNNMTCIAPIFWSHRSTLIFFDLYMEIDSLIRYLNVTDINKINIKQLHVLGISIVNINKCPIFLPIHFFTSHKLLKLNIKMDMYFQKIQTLQKNFFILKKIKYFFENYSYHQKTDNVDLRIYDSFFSQQEKNVMRKLHSIQIKNWDNINFDFNKKLKEMFFRLRARNFPELLNKSEKLIWKKHLSRVFSANILENYFSRLREFFKKYNTNDTEYQLLTELKQYVRNLIN